MSRIYRNGRVVDVNGICRNTGTPAEGLVHAASFSTLKHFAESRGNYRDTFHLGTRAQPDSPAFPFGRLYHKAVLEPEEFAKIVRAPDFDRRLKPGKRALEAHESGARLVFKPAHMNRRGAKNRAEYDEWQADNEGAVICDDEGQVEEAEGYLDELREVEGMETAPARELNAAEQIREAVWANPHAAKLFDREGYYEKELSWLDETGLQVFAHPDFISAAVVVDLKGDRDPRPRQFTSTIEKRMYHMQAAIYAVGAYQELYGFDAEPEFWHVVVRNEAPFEVACYQMDPAWVNDGAREFRYQMNELALCLKTDDWRNNWEKTSNVLMRPPWAAASAIAYEVGA